MDEVSSPFLEIIDSLQSDLPERVGADAQGVEGRAGVLGPHTVRGADVIRTQLVGARLDVNYQNFP